MTIIFLLANIMLNAVLKLNNLLVHYFYCFFIMLVAFPLSAFLLALSIHVMSAVFPSISQTAHSAYCLFFISYIPLILIRILNVVGCFALCDCMY